MKLEASREEDLPEIVALTNLAFRGGAGWTVENTYIEGERISLENLKDDIAESPGARLMIWREAADDRLLGSVWLEPKKSGVWYMGMLAVHPERQEQQLGRKMLEASEALVRQEKGERIRISVVNVRDRLIAWYERRGYVRTGEREPFPYGNERFGHPLRDDLEFIMLEKAL